MQTLELNALVDENHELHLKLPDKIKQGWARIIVEYEDVPTEAGSAYTRKFGLCKGKGTVPDDVNKPLSDAFWKSIGSCKHSARIRAPNPLMVESMMRS